MFFEKKEDMTLFSGSDKVVKLFYPDILTYGEWLKASNDLSEGEVSILINADIYLDQSLANLRIHSEYLKNEKKLIPKSGINLRNFIDTLLGRKDLKAYIKSRMTGKGIAVDENKILSKCDRILYIKNDQNEEKIKINSYETKVLMLNSDHNGVSLNINI